MDKLADEVQLMVTLPGPAERMAIRRHARISRFWPGWLSRLPSSSWGRCARTGCGRR